MNWGEFFAMGGYAAYVWPSYAIAVIVLVINIVSAHLRTRNVVRTLAEFYQAKKVSK